MLEPAKSVANLLYANWSIGDPGKDTATAETFLPDRVGFWTRYWAAPPQRIHNHQISVLGGPETSRLLTMGTSPRYEIRTRLMIHAWALPGTSESFDAEQTRIRNTQDEVDRILRVLPTSATDIQFIESGPGWNNLDELVEVLRFHRAKAATAIYFQ